MRRFLLLLIILISSFLILSQPAYALGDWEVADFRSNLEIEKETSLLVTETINVNFSSEKHGIFRVIPIIYSGSGKTIRASFHLLSVTDEKGNLYEYVTSRLNQSIQIKIGDPERTITGPHLYVIKYRMGDVIKRYQDHDELYWNVTGSEWEVPLVASYAFVVSPWAKITKTTCFAGPVGAKSKNCQENFNDDLASFSTSLPVGQGSDFTIVVALDKQGELQFPSPLEMITKSILDNWGYFLIFPPSAVMFVLWFKRGRDQRFLAETVYYKPEDQKTKAVSFWERKYLPLAYTPIKGLTPAEIGVIIDERVDIRDVVSEIVELARLGFIEIKKEEKKGLFGKTDYTFVKKEKETQALRSYQQYLLEKLFSSAEAEVRLSSLKNKFYQNLEEFKKKLYQNLADNKIFDGNPEKTRIKWLVIFILTQALFSALAIVFSIQSFNFTPLVLGFVFAVPGAIFAYSMPRRTAWGYSLFRQAHGLRYFLEKGKWRYEIAEKNLFIEEILPWAISLGVVGQLAKDMEEFKMKPPDYVSGFIVSNFASDFSRFQTQAAGSFSPSGRSSWSGGSGFSGGGSSGGGFGGGGGGSW